MEKTSFYTEIGKNKRNSVLLVAIIVIFLSVFVFIIGAAIAPEAALLLTIVALVLVVIQAYASYMYGDKIVLSTTGAKPADPVKHIYLINTVEGIALAAGLPVPKIYVLPSKEINAFATGRDPKHASVAFTEGALETLNRQELEGVIAHEMSHIGNYDIRFFVMIGVFVGLIAILSQMFLRSMWYSGGGGGKKNDNGGILIVVGIILAIVAPIIVRLVQLSISRKREYLADATGVKLTRYPPGLAGALEKIKAQNKGNMQVSEAVSHFFISDPKNTFFDSIFATHPPIEKRIEKLRSM